MNRSSVIWSAVRNWGPRLGTILTFFVLVRLLSPAEIGVFAAAVAVVALLELLADNGLGDAVVQAKAIPSSLTTAVLLFNLAIAIALYAAVFFFAERISLALGVAGAEDVLRVASLVLIVNALSYVPQAILRRELQFKRLAMRSLASTVGGAVTGVAMAFLGFGVWSMVGQLLVTGLVNTLFAWVPLVLRLSIPDFFGSTPLLRFGSRVFVSRVLYYASSRLIEIVIPVFFGPTALGLYFMGSRLPAVLAQMTSAVMVDVSFPHFSRLAGDRAALYSAFLSSVEFSAATAVPLFMVLGALAPEIAIVAFGPNGAGSQTLMLPLAVLGCVQSIGFYNQVLMNACGLPEITMRISALTAALAGVMFYLLKDTDIDVFVYGYAGLQSLMVPTGFVIARRHEPFPLRRLARVSAPFYLSGLASVVAVFLAREAIAAHVGHAFVRGIVLGIVFTATYVLLLLIFDRQALMRPLASLRLGRKGRAKQ